MTRHVRSWAIAALAVFALAGAAAPSFAGIVYNVTNYADGQNGWSVNGTISVSGAGTYTDDASAITAWDVIVSKNTASYQFTNALAGHNELELTGALTASTGKLDLLGFLALRGNGFVNILNWNAVGMMSPQYSARIDSTWVFNSSSFSPVESGAWTIGVASPSAVPEIDPATGGSALSLVAGVLAMIEQRRRRAMLVA